MPAVSAARHPRTVAVRLLIQREPWRIRAKQLRKMLTREASGEFKFVSAGTVVETEATDAKSQTCEGIEQLVR